MIDFTKIGCLCVLSLSLSVACTSGTETTSDEDTELTKDEARARLAGKADDGLSFDICDRSGWYGDGVCDDFCDMPDPDCDMGERLCEQFVGEAPVCPSGWVEVGDCPQGACEQVFGTGDQCNVMIECFSAPDFCPQTLGTEPTCPSGTQQVSACASEECTVVMGDGDRCDEFVLCEPDEGPSGFCPQVVGEMPTCDAGDVQVPECPAGSTCREVFGTGDRCDASVLCLVTPDFCPQVVGNPATCPAGTREVASCTDATCSAVVGDGDQCADVALCEQGAPRRVRTSSTSESVDQPNQVFLNSLGLSWVAYHKFEISQACTIASARVSFDITSLDGSDDVSVLVLPSGQPQGNGWWVRLGPVSFEASGNLPLSGTYGYGPGDARPDTAPDGTRNTSPFEGLNSQGTWTIYAIEKDRDPLHDFSLDTSSIEFDCLD